MLHYGPNKAKYTRFVIQCGMRIFVNCSDFTAIIEQTNLPPGNEIQEITLLNDEPTSICAHLNHETEFANLVSTRPLKIRETLGSYDAVCVK